MFAEERAAIVAQPLQFLQETMPHRAADHIVAAASTVMALQTIVSRNIDPLPSAMVTVGALHAGKANKRHPAFGHARS